MAHKKDIPVLAAVLYSKPEYFLTGDAHFFTDKVTSVVPVFTAKEFLSKIK
jgi:predicted nucleic acid-binding protein